MNFRADAKKFYEALSRLYNLTADSRITNPPVLLECEGDYITMHLQSPSVLANVTLQVEVVAPGAEVFVAKHLMPVLAILQGETEFDCSGTQMVIEGSSRVKVPLWGTKDAQSPVEVEVNKGHYIDMRPFSLFDGITICNDWIGSNDMGLLNTAYRKLPEPICDDKEFYLPPNVGALLDGSVGVEIRDGWLHAVGEGYAFKSPGNDGYKSIRRDAWDTVDKFVSESVSHVKVDTKKLAGLVTAIGNVFAVKEISGAAAVRLSLDGDTLIVESPPTEFGEFNGSVPVLASGEEGFDVVVNSIQFSKAISVFKGSEVAITRIPNAVAIIGGDLRMTNSTLATTAFSDVSKETLDAKAKTMEQENEIRF